MLIETIAAHRRQQLREALRECERDAAELALLASDADSPALLPFVDVQEQRAEALRRAACLRVLLRSAGG